MPPKRPERPSILPAGEQPRGPRAPTRAAIEAASPWLPVAYERHDVVAWQALQAGKADAAQQKTVIEWLKRASGVYEMTYFPGPDGARNSDFAQGKRFVGLQIVKMMLLNPGMVKASNPNADPHEPK